MSETPKAPASAASESSSKIVPAGASGSHRLRDHTGHTGLLPNAGNGGHHEEASFKNKKALAAVSLGALGVVYGDIGTSPLYAMKECLSSAHGVHIPEAVKKGDASAIAAFMPHWDASVLGVLSLMFWAMILVVVVKYLTFIMKADNKGEGGILALAALVGGRDAAKPKQGRLSAPILMALFGAGLLYGDGVITPAISVLGAVEGLSEQSPTFTPLVVPITIGILITLFLFQRLGTAKIGAVFGWVMLVWFVVIAIAGVPQLIENTSVLRALNPYYAVYFLVHGGWHGFLILGLVVLCITGGEALYADMGHFGRLPIRLAWYTIVMPGLFLNYLGQGALYLSRPPGSISNPFFSLIPNSLLIPAVILATMAAIIASQALISGAFSLTKQAVQLGYLPRVTIVHTSSKSEGQIYIPEVNYLLMVACLVLVVAFGSSTKLASAYGIAVTGTMGITSYLYYLVCRHNWGYKRSTALLLFIPFVVIDLAFFVANFTKVREGGWVPLAMGAGLFLIMTTWWRGRSELSQSMAAGSIADELFLADIAGTRLPRVPGTAVFMASSSEGIPNVLLHHIKHNKVLHKQVILLSIVTENVPFIKKSALELRELKVPADEEGGEPQHIGFYRLIARVGFKQRPNVPQILTKCQMQGITINQSDTTYYLGRQTLLVTGKSPLALWRKMLFSFLSRNSRPPTAFFQLPPNRVVELGLQIEL
jgi:KUP system potassium uptake protein